MIIVMTHINGFKDKNHMIISKNGAKKKKPVTKSNMPSKTKVLETKRLVVKYLNIIKAMYEKTVAIIILNR